MSSHLIIARFPNIADAEHASRNIQMFASKDEGLTINSGILLKKGNDGKPEVIQTQSRAMWGPVIGAVTGTLIGMLGGPVGAALGFTIGTSAGIAEHVMSDVLDDESIKREFAVLPVGQVALILEANEDTPARVNTFVSEAGGAVFRRGL